MRPTDASADPALATLVELFHAELRQIAHRERVRGAAPSETLRTTALVNEAYLRLSRQAQFRDRGHFLATAALAMRHALVNHARARQATKRGGGQRDLPLEAADAVAIEEDQRILAVDAALVRLEAVNARYARVVECRYFAGLDVTETALAIGVTERTVMRDWAKARALLYEALETDA